MRGFHQLRSVLVSVIEGPDDRFLEPILRRHLWLPCSAHSILEETVPPLDGAFSRYGDDIDGVNKPPLFFTT